MFNTPDMNPLSFKDSKSKITHYRVLKIANNLGNGKTVYKIPHSKWYHYDPNCTGKNSSQIQLK